MIEDAKAKLKLIALSIKKFEKFQKTLTQLYHKSKEMQRISQHDPEIEKVIEYFDNKNEQLFVTNVIKGMCLSVLPNLMLFFN